MDTKEPSLALPEAGAVVLAVAFSPDGSTLASVARDSMDKDAVDREEYGYGLEIRLWDVGNGRLKAAMKDSSNLSVETDAEFSPDGYTLATMSPQGVRLWDVASGRLRTTLRDSVDWADRLAYSPDGSLLASGNTEQSGLRLWDTASGLLKTTLPTPGSKIEGLSVAFSPDGSSLADGNGRLWDVATGQFKADLKRDGRYLPVRSLAFSPNGSTLVTSRFSGTVLSDLGGRWKVLLHGRLDVGEVAFSPDGLTLACAIKLDGWPPERAVLLWDMTAYPPYTQPIEIVLEDSLGYPMAETRLLVSRSVPGEDFFWWETSTDKTGRAPLAVARDGYYHVDIDYLPPGYDYLVYSDYSTPDWTDIPLVPKRRLTLKLTAAEGSTWGDWPAEVLGLSTGRTELEIQVLPHEFPRDVWVEPRPPRVEVSRSISGRPPHYVWSTRADSTGRATLSIVTAGTATGFYMVRVDRTHLDSGYIWHSIPLNEGYRQAVRLRKGNRSRIVAREPLSANKLAGPPVATALAPIFPNPFNAIAWIDYRLAESGRVRVVIYNALGQPVRTLVDAIQPPGRYRASWDARDDRGFAVAAGVYVLRLIGSDGVLVRPLLYLK